MLLKNKFPFFRKTKYIYLDSAATTQVPDIVIQGITQTLEFRGNPGRSAHGVSNRNQELLENAKTKISNFIGAFSDEIIFTNNTTDSINVALDSIIHLFEDGDIILVSISEHHSNILPYLKANKNGAKIKLLGIKDGLVDPDEIKNALSSKTRLVAVAQCSNVLGNINNVEEIGKIIKEYNKDIVYVVDGTQAVAHIPVDVKKIQADFYAFSSHKMYGPDGVGVLYISKKIQHLIKPVKAGGGTVKDVAITREKDFDIISPDYDNSLSILEGGTPNTSNIIGLSKAVGFILSNGWKDIRNHEVILMNKILNGLSSFDEVTIYGPENIDEKIGLISFSLRDLDTKELSDYLSSKNICIRYGSHCAFPLAEEFGNETLRVSIGIYNTEEDIDIFLQEVKFFLDKKKGLIKNPNIEKLKNIPFTKTTQIISSQNDIYEMINSMISDRDNTEIVIMAGHFLAIPDVMENKFYPSIKEMIPERLHGLLEEFGMTTFPIFTLETAVEIISKLKENGVNAKLMIVANDTTGINELRLSDNNKDVKTAKDYRDELLDEFRQSIGIPDVYKKVLDSKGLSVDDIVKYGEGLYFRETIMRANFKNFIDKNKEYFDGIIDYKSDDESIDVGINILENQSIKTCVFDTFHSKTGGKFCIVEVADIISELFGSSDNIYYEYLNEKVKNPIIKSKDKLFVMFSPAMCNNAVNSGAEFYIKLFLGEDKNQSFKFINVPFGPNADNNIKDGIDVYKISNK